MLCFFPYLVSQFYFFFSFLFFFLFLRKKLNNIIKKDRLNHLEIQKKVAVEHPPSILKVWNINSMSSQTMSNRVWFCYIGSSSNNKLCNVILASPFLTFLVPLQLLETSKYALFNHTFLHCAMLEWIFQRFSTFICYWLEDVPF